MITTRTTVRMLAARRQAPGLAADITDLFRTLVKALFDPYRPELHYMRGPGPKWHAKHARPFQLGPDVVALPAMVPAAKRSIRPRHLVVHAASLVLGIALFVIAFLFISPTASKADATNCAQVSELAASRVRWAAARQGRVDSAEAERKCRAYRIHFYDAVTARQAASICEDSINRQRELALLDGEIDAFNNLIAAQCGG